MRSELNEVVWIDQYLFRRLSQTEQRSFEAQLLVSGALAEKVEAQRLAHRLIRLFSRKKELDRLEGIHRQLLEEPAFANQLRTIFS